MLKLLCTTAIVVFFATILDLALLHRHATVGKLMWSIKLLPNIGGQL
jgi:hypothetical protein